MLKSVNIDLAFGDRMFPDGPGSQAVNNNCWFAGGQQQLLGLPFRP
jgi:hypothetical protein